MEGVVLISYFHRFDSQITSITADAARKAQLRKAHAMEAADRSQKRGKGLQKLGSAVCRMPVRFKLATAADADPPRTIAYAKSCHGCTSSIIIQFPGNVRH